MSQNQEYRKSGRSRRIDFTQISNELICNPELTGKEKWILIYLLSKPEGWNARVSDIAKHTADGESAVQSGILALRKAGFAQLYKIIDQNKRVKRWITTYSDQRVSWYNEKPLAVTEELYRAYEIDCTMTPWAGDRPEAHIPEDEEPELDFPRLENQGQYKYIDPSNKESNNPLTPFQGGAANAAAFSSVETFGEPDSTTTVQGQEPGNRETAPTPSMADSPKRSNLRRARNVSSATKLAQQTTDEIVSMIVEGVRERFPSFWTWYCKLCAGYDAEPGDKKQAAIAFLQTITPENIEDFREGCRQFARQKESQKEKNGKAMGIPHCNRFIAGSKTNHPTPYWQAALEAISAADESTNDFVPIHRKFLKEVLRDELGEHPYTHEGCMKLERYINKLSGNIPYEQRTFQRWIEPFRRKYASYPDLDHFIEAGIRYGWISIEPQCKAKYEFKVYGKTVAEVDYINW